MRICILSDELIEDFNPAELMKGYEWDFWTVEPPVEEFVCRVLSTKEYDAFLNICEGDEDNTVGFDMVQTLERFNLPFTGADTKFYNPTREQMQAVAESNGIRFARGFNAAHQADLENASLLQYPLMVKHTNGFGSEGITPQSRVTTDSQLLEQFQRICSAYGSARIEEFIDGREVTCFVVDNPDDLTNPYVYQPAEVKFPEGESFLHIEVKWYNWGTFFVPFDSKDLTKKVQQVSRQLYLALDGTGYSRVDLRIRPNGEVVAIEINPNCGILYYGPDDRGPADLPISWDKDGHAGFLDRIFRAAILRKQIRAERS